MHLAILYYDISMKSVTLHANLLAETMLMKFVHFFQNKSPFNRLTPANYLKHLFKI